MSKLPTKILTDLKEFRDSQEKLIEHYLSENNNEMVYLVRWSILEKVVKTLTSEYRRNLLIASLHDWLSHIEKGTQKPPKKPETVIELKTLPQKKEFIAALDFFSLHGLEIWGVMDSNGKHRRHRNELAHTGKKFVNYLLYHSLCFDMEKITSKIYKILI